MNYSKEVQESKAVLYLDVQMGSSVIGSFYVTSNNMVQRKFSRFTFPTLAPIVDLLGRS